MSEEQEKQKKLGNRKKPQPDDETLHRLIYVAPTTVLS